MHSPSSVLHISYITAEFNSAILPNRWWARHKATKWPAAKKVTRKISPYISSLLYFTQVTVAQKTVCVISHASQFWRNVSISQPTLFTLKDPILNHNPLYLRKPRIPPTSSKMSVRSGNFGDQTAHQTAGFFQQPRGDERTKEVQGWRGGGVEESTFLMGAHSAACDWECRRMKVGDTHCYVVEGPASAPTGST